MRSAEIRKRFKSYFKNQDHQLVESASLVPSNDPTLLFVNAGMVPFKDNFTGAASPQNKRAVSIQKCVRAGGKHNDLENVGFTARHHTFFEMMGNFSFGDYFKKQAIEMAWGFLTKELKIPKEKLYITAHFSDTEAKDIWLNEIGVDANHFFYRGDKDNFWEMGELGPCGPCSEIFYDHGEGYSDPAHQVTDCVLDDESRYVEIWNLVFMQFEKYREGKEIKTRELPKPSIDTGSGLERVACAMQGKYNNFDTDLFASIISELEKYSKKKYSDEKYKNAFRVVADHVRASTFLITDGVLPSNEGRGYVLRRIIRRAVRFLDQLGIEDSVLYKLVKAVFEPFDQEYPENFKNLSMAEKYLKIEEQNFRKTLKSGLNLLEKEISLLNKIDKKVLSGKIAFNLYDTHGMPVDLTELILKENGLSLDQKEFDKQMFEQKQRSRQSSQFKQVEGDRKAFYQIKEKFSETLFLGYTSLSIQAKLLSIVPYSEGRQALIFDQTSFYGESGGQAGDKGIIKCLETDSEFEIIDTQKPIDGLIAHIVATEVPQSMIGQLFELTVNEFKRVNTCKNHTATHLLHAALREILGDHVKQAGSYVDDTKLRFDFSHPIAMTKLELCDVEKKVNDVIFKALDVTPEDLSKNEALDRGAMALFGEKYGDKVRVLTIGDYSIELCGGTHVKNTQEIGLFKLISESSLASGVRRIEASTSYLALDQFVEKMDILESLEKQLSTGATGLLNRVSQLQQLVKEQDKEIGQLNATIQSLKSNDLFENKETLANGQVFTDVEVQEGEDLRKLGDLFIGKNKNGIVLLTSKNGDKASVLLKTFKGNTEINCSDVLKSALSAHGGRGGGKPDMAQGSLETKYLSQLKGEIKQQFGINP